MALVIPLTFQDHVRHALDGLPPEIVRKLENVAVVVEDEHPEEPTSTACSRAAATTCPTGSRSTGSRSRGTSPTRTSSSTRSG